MAPACFTTREEGELLRRDVAALQSELAQMQRQQSDERTQDSARLDDLQGRIATLEATLGALRQADADVGVQLDKVIAELQTLRGEVEQARYELGETSASVKDILARPPVSVAAAAGAPRVDAPSGNVTIGGASVPAEARPHYELSKRLYDERRYPEAVESFDLFLQRHAKTTPDLVDNAAFWKAEAYFAQASAQSDTKLKEKALKQAILAYQRVVEDPRSEKGDGALYKSGMAFEQLGFTDEAVVFYDELVAKHPKSPLIGDAKKRLKALAGTKRKKAR